MTRIYEKIGEPAVLEGLAEECSELAHAALKLARYLRDENPTPVREEDARKSFLEEVADVTLCLDVWLLSHDYGCRDIIYETMQEKRERWETRLQVR